MTENNNSTSWKTAAIWTAVTLTILVVLVLSVRKKSNTDIQSLNVVIKTATGQRQLITKKDVAQLFTKNIGYDVVKSRIGELDMRELESILTADKRVKRAEIFLDKSHTLNVFIQQREPIVRVMGSEASYYIDEDGDRIPLYGNRAIRIPVATGYIEAYDKKKLLSEKPSSIKRVYELAQAISYDDFLQALVEQIDIERDGSVTIVPKLGNQKLEMGKLMDVEKQLKKLKLFYKKGINNVGWKQHSAFRLDVNGQVIGRKIRS